MSKENPENQYSSEFDSCARRSTQKGLQLVAHSGLEHYQEPPQTHYLSEVENYVTFIPTNPSQSNLRTPKFSSDTRQYCGLSKSRAVATLGGVLGGEIGKRNKKVDDGTRSPTGAVKSVTILQTIPTPQLARSLQTSVSSGPTPTITLGPTETYSKISSPSGTLFRDCPASNGTIVTTANIPPQRFVKTCDWIYKPTDGNIFDTYTSTLKGCISLCAAYNTINATEPLGICTDVAWRTGSGECFGNVGGRVGPKSINHPKLYLETPTSKTLLIPTRVLEAELLLAMAAPPSKSLKDLNGKWIMNKTLSDDTDSILAMQGVSWFLRKAIAYATITLSIHEYEEDGTTHIDIAQTATGGISGTTELRTLDWSYRGHKDGIFGEVKGKSRWVKVKDLDDDDDKQWLSKGWDDPEGEHVQSYVESVGNGWTANQVWGFEVLDGKRYYVRHVVVRKKDDWKQARLVYDYQG